MSERTGKVLAVTGVLFLTALAAPGQGPSLRPPTKETLDYSIEWRLITAGKARVITTAAPGGVLPGQPGGGGQNGPQASEVQLHLESAGLVSRLFKVEDNYSATLGSGFCVQSTLTQAKEGSRNRETRVTFDGPGKDPQTRHATYLEKDLVKNAVISQETDVPACVHDVIGGLMYLRTQRIDPGRTLQVPVSDGKKFVLAKVESQRREPIKTPLGTFNTIRYEVYLFDNILYRRSGHLHIWLTDDERRLPVQVEVRLQFAIGTITLQLEKEQRQ